MIENVKITDTRILSDNWYILKKITYQYNKRDGITLEQSREVYDRGNGAVILLYNKAHQSVILTRQFRLPTFVNGNESGMLIEACAGLLETKNPDDCIRRETEEETGYTIKEVKKIFEAYMSPGSVSEILHYYIAEYSPEMKKYEGGGIAAEEENIEVLEMSFDKAFQMIESGEIKDGKTILLLYYLKLHKIL